MQKNTFWFKDAVDRINNKKSIRYYRYLTFDYKTWITVNTRVLVFFKWWLCCICCFAVTTGFSFTQHYCWTRRWVRWIGHKSKVSVQKRRCSVFIMQYPFPAIFEFYRFLWYAWKNWTYVSNLDFYICIDDSQEMLDFHIISTVVALWTSIL